MKKNMKNNMGYYIELYLKSSSIKNKNSTNTTYRYIISKYIYPYFKDYSRDNIDIGIILSFIDKLSHSGLKNKSIRDIILILKGILKLMDIRIDIPMPKLEKLEIQVIPKKNQIKLEKYLLENLSPIHFGIYLSLYTGLRIGEICALNKDDIDLFENKIIIRHTVVRVLSNQSNKKTVLLLNSPKTNSSFREIPFPSFLLSYYEKIHYQEHSYILTNTKKYMDTRNLLYHYKKILKELDLDNYTYHSIRHTFATRLIQEGCDHKTLSLLLGHSSIKITLERYVHPSYHDKKIFMSKLKPLV